MTTQTHSVKTLYLVRHGELIQSGILCGHTDIPLSEKGWQQLKNTTHKLSNITSCYSSSLTRCLSFSKHYAQQRHIPLDIDERLREMNFGDWDGLPYKTLWDAPTTDLANATHISQFWSNPWEYPPPQGESMPEFSARVESAWQNICSAVFSSKSPSQGDVLIVSHGGVIKQILAKILQIPLTNATHLNTLEVKYGALIKISLFNDGHKIWPQVVFE